VRGAPGYIEHDQHNDKPKDERFIVLEWEQATSDNRENECPDEKRSWLDAAAPQECLLDETAKVVWLERNRV
jgi:hypothetical protein